MTSAISSTEGNAGFTLLELLVALALMATIAATMAAAIAQLRPMQRFQARLDERAIENTIADVIARDVQAAVSIPLIEAGGTSSTVLKGGPQKIVFTGVVRTGYQRVGLREVSYELIKADGKSRVVRTIKMRRFTQQGTNTQVDELLAGDFDLQLQYLIRNAEGEAEWRDEFSQLVVLPEAISIRLSLHGRSLGPTMRTVSFRENI